MNNTTAHSPPPPALPAWGFLAVGAYMLCIGLINLIGNSFVLMVSYYRRKKIKPPEVFTINLAVTDLLLLVCAYPWLIASSFNHGWLFGEVGCEAYAFFRLMLGLVNIATITSLAVVRYQKVCRSKQVKDMSWTSLWVSVAGTWVYGAFWAAMPLLGWSRYTEESFDIACTVDWKTARDSPEGAAYMILLFVFCYFVPIVVIVTCYVCVLRTVRSSRKNVSCTPGRGKMDTEKKLTKIAMMVAVGFVLAWTPYSLVSLYATFRDLKSLPIVISILPSLFAKSSSIYNPVIYFFMNASFRRDVTALIKFTLPAGGSLTSGQTTWKEATPSSHPRYMLSEMRSPNDSPAKTTTTTALVSNPDKPDSCTWV